MAEAATELPSLDELRRWIGWRLDEIGGARVGKVEGVYVDHRSGEPAWLLARIGHFGRHSLVPVHDAVAGVGRVWVPYARELLRGAPRIEPGDDMDLERERELSSYYRIDRGAELAARGTEGVTSRPAD